jgi:hypothetical protein
LRTGVLPTERFRQLGGDFAVLLRLASSVQGAELAHDLARFVSLVWRCRQCYEFTSAFGGIADIDQAVPFKFDL